MHIHVYIHITYMKKNSDKNTFVPQGGGDEMRPFPIRHFVCKFVCGSMIHMNMPR